MKARKIRPTGSDSWPTEPHSVPPPRLTGDIAATLYANRMAQQEGEWAEMDRILAENRVAWRKRKKAAQVTPEETRQDLAEVEL